MAAAKLARETLGQTLQATALVDEAYLRLVDVEQAQHWESRRHFFAAAETMRRILVEKARRKSRVKRGGPMRREDLDDVEVECDLPQDESLHALARLSDEDPQKAKLVELRFFAGLGLRRFLRCTISPQGNRVGQSLKAEKKCQQ